MTETLFTSRTALFPFSVLQSLAAISCLACLSNFGADSGLHVATASATFVFCSLGSPNADSRGESQTAC